MNEQEDIDLNDYQKITDVYGILSNIIPNISSVIMMEDYITIMKILDGCYYYENIGWMERFVFKKGIYK